MSSKKTPTIVENLQSASKKNPLDLNLLTKLVIVLLIGTSVFYLAKRYRGLFVSAVVNKTIISRYELNQELYKAYGENMLQSLIDQKIILSEANKMGIKVTREEAEQEIEKIKTQMGDEEFASALERSGYTMETLVQETIKKLTYDRLAEKVAVVEVKPDEIVADYEAGKTTLYVGKKIDEVRSEIEAKLKSEKAEASFYSWFEGVKASAQINTYLE